MQLLFDTHRNLLYAMKAHEIDVFNPSSLQWQSPLQLPSSPTALSFGYMALSPDGTKMVIATASQQVVVFDPEEPAQAAVVTNPFGLTGGSSVNVAITQSNTALISGTQYALLDLASLSFTPESQVPVSSSLVKASADGSHLYEITSGIENVCAIDPSSSVPQCGGLLEVPWTDLAVSADGSQFAAVVTAPGSLGGIVVFYDSTLHDSNTNEYPDLSPPTDGGVIGATYSPKGNVLVLALGNSIEFWNTAQGILVARLMTPEELPAFAYPDTFQPLMALDSAGQTIYAVSASGLTVLKLPTPIDQMTPAQWPMAAHGGGASEFRGSLAQRVAAMKARSARMAHARH